MSTSYNDVVQLARKEWRTKVRKREVVSMRETFGFVLTVPSLSMPNRSAISMIRFGRNVPSKGNVIVCVVDEWMYV